MEDITLKKIITESSKVVPTAQSMELYLRKMKESLASAVTAFENGFDSTAAMYVGEANFAMQHIEEIWNTIINK